MLYYARSTNGFYDSTINKAIPEDAVEITVDVHRLLMLHQSRGGTIQANSTGFPIAAPPKPYDFSVWDGDRWTSNTEKIRKDDEERERTKITEIEKKVSLCDLIDVLIERGVISYDDLPSDMQELLKERDALKRAIA